MLIGWVTPYLVHVSDSAYYAYVFSCLISTRSVFKRVSIQFRITREVDSKYCEVLTIGVTAKGSKSESELK